MKKDKKICVQGIIEVRPKVSHEQTLDLLWVSSK